MAEAAVPDHQERRFSSAIFDVDGTLVDSNYQHVIAWHRAFRTHGVPVPLWQIHRHIGMGGDKLVPAVAGDEVERAQGQDLRDAWQANFEKLLDEVEPLPGARELLRDVKDAGVRLILASSGEPAHVEHFIDLLGVRDIADGWTTSGDVENTKPEPELLEVALSKAREGPAITFGDSTWDCEAARRLDLPVIGLRTGGFALDELRAAGAHEVFASLDDLRSALGRILRG